MEAAARLEQLAELLLTALTKKVWSAMKAKGFRDSYWRPRLNKAEEKWWQSRLAKANAREVHGLRIGATYAAILDEANVKMRSLRRRLPQTSCVWSHAMVVTLSTCAWFGVL